MDLRPSSSAGNPEALTDVAKEPAEVQLPLGTGNAWIELNMPTPLDL